MLPTLSRRVLPTLFTIAGVLLLPIAALAQDGNPPTVSFSPNGGTFSTASVSVTITWCDAQSKLSPTTRQILLNGASVTSSFSYTAVSIGGCFNAARSVGTINLNVGNNTLNASIRDLPGNLGQRLAVFTRTSNNAAAVLSLAPHSGTLRDVARCVAECFEQTLSYSTAPYISLDVPRSVTLVYRSGQARPRGTVQIDATDPSQVPAQTLALLLRRPDGSFVTFTNGSQELYFTGGAGTTRLAAQFDASSLPTGAHSYTAVVRSRWSDGTLLESSTPIRVIVLNEIASPLGSGWTFAGIQRLHVQSDGILVTDGAGSASFFAGSCPSGGTCGFTAPAGDFSTLNQTGFTYRRRYPDGTIVDFRSDGRATSTADRFGNTTSFAYDGSGKFAGLTDPAGVATAIGYEDGSGGWKIGSLRYISGPGPRNAWFGVDGANDLRHLLDVDGIHFGFADYDGAHGLTHFRDRRGGDWDHGYASDLTVATTQVPTITANGVAMRPTTSLVGPARRLFDAIAQGYGTAASPVARTIDLRATITNPRSYPTHYTLNRYGSATRIDDALGRVARNEYHATTGQLTRSTAPSGHDIGYIWDGPRLTQVNDASVGGTVQTSYETTYNRPTHIWGNVVEQWFYYTGARMDSTRTGGVVTRYTSDSRGRVLTVADAGGHTTRTVYQASGFQNTDSIIAPGSRVTRFKYDGLGRKTFTFTPSSLDSVEYDGLNRVTATVDGAWRRTTFQYDSLYLRRVTDAKGQAYTYSPNALGWVEQEQRAGSTRALITAYDANGNVTSRQNRRLQTVSYVYDALDRMTSRTADGLTTTVGYVLYGVASGGIAGYTAFSNSESSDTLFIDVADRVKRVNTGWFGSWYSVDVGYNVDGTRARLDVTSNQFVSSGNRFYYNARQALDSMYSFAGTLKFTKDNEDQPTTITYPNALTRTRKYTSMHSAVENTFNVGAVNSALGVYIRQDELGRIKEREYADSLHRYWYEIDGSVSSRELFHLGPRSCGFDPDYGRVCSQNETPAGAEGATYDNVGNLMNGVTSLATGNRIMAANGYTFNYDDDGNLTSKQGPGFNQILEWNSLGQLVRVTTNGTVAEFGYDGLGRRVRRTVSGVTKRYLHDGNNLFAELNSAGQLTAEYANLPGLDQPVAVNRHSGSGTWTTYYVMKDPVAGNVTGLVRAADNQLMAHYRYTVFGQLMSGSFDNVPGSVDNGSSIRFAGREYDEATGLYYNRARYYDPQLGRFISEDPVGIQGGINLYAYAGNDPVNAGDPTGLFVTDDDGMICSIFASCSKGGSYLDSYMNETAGYLIAMEEAKWGRLSVGVWVGSMELQWLAPFRHGLIALISDKNTTVYELIGWFTRIANQVRQGSSPFYTDWSSVIWWRIAPASAIPKFENAIGIMKTELEGKGYLPADSNRFIAGVLYHAGYSLTDKQRAALDLVGFSHSHP